MAEASYNCSDTFYQCKLYSSLEDIETKYCGGSIEDQIGIILLGQQNLDDCIDLRPISADGNVTFPSYCLPQTKTDFYQFVYIKRHSGITARSLPFIIQIPLDELTSIQEDYLNFGPKPGSPNISLAECEHLNNSIHDLYRENTTLKMNLPSLENHRMEKLLHEISQLAKESDDLVKQRESEMKDLSLIRNEARIHADRNKFIEAIISKKVTIDDLTKEISEKEEKIGSLEQSKDNTLQQVELCKKENISINKQLEDLKRNFSSLCKKILSKKHSSPTQDDFAHETFCS